MIKLIMEINQSTLESDLNYIKNFSEDKLLRGNHLSVSLNEENVYYIRFDKKIKKYNLYHCVELNSHKLILQTENIEEAKLFLENKIDELVTIYYK